MAPIVPGWFCLIKFHIHGSHIIQCVFFCVCLVFWYVTSAKRVMVLLGAIALTLCSMHLNLWDDCCLPFCKIVLFSIICVCVGMCVRSCSSRGSGSLGAGVTDSCELSSEGTANLGSSGKATCALNFPALPAPLSS